MRCAATSDDVAVSGSDQIANKAIHLVLCHLPGIEPLTEMLHDDAIAARLRVLNDELGFHLRDADCLVISHAAFKHLWRMDGLR